MKSSLGSRLVWNNVLIVTAVLSSLLLPTTTVSALNEYNQRERDRRANLDMMNDDEHEDDHHRPIGSLGPSSILSSSLFHPGLVDPSGSHLAGHGIADHHVTPQGQCEPIKISKFRVGIQFKIILVLRKTPEYRKFLFCISNSDSALIP